MTEQSITATGSQTSVKKGALIAWAFYDWANNGFATVILTFIFSAIFYNAMLSGSQRIGMSMVIVLLLTGGILMLNVAKAS